MHHASHRQIHAVGAAIVERVRDAMRWVADIAHGLNTVTVLVQQPPARHEVKMQDFLAWLRRQGGSPAEIP